MRIEPTADMRQGAAMLYQFYIALVSSGFNQDQALELVKTQLMVAAGRDTGDSDAD